MKKNKSSNKASQFQIDFDTIKASNDQGSFSKKTTIPNNTNVKVIYLSQVISQAKKAKENELREFVLKNTKSF